MLQGYTSGSLPSLHRLRFLFFKARIDSFALKARSQVNFYYVQWLIVKLCTMKKKYHLLLVLNLPLDNFIWSPLGLVLQQTVNEHSLFISSITLLYRFLSFSSLAISLLGWRSLIYLIALYHCHPFLVLLSLSLFSLHPSFKYGDQNCSQSQDKITGSL